ncbi:hypothetical protein [Stigmatella aurantiaca]|uniref:Conserved uncharacterized protein n=1 Tax=Stigmatella aurantiaca (strain DW4/3-1) TaxID=378806 RepID=Q099B5_STIAD|nr:hypothetical protein [Stigmatella aurantiaca]ADO75565.1 conserved uncharacterized protein [Stigmatella aurantiaca DW4/3-1]EAU68389.1 hypothetical protein STIAU_3949 [Stigmatella aurantiaca DW4/3-1]
MRWVQCLVPMVLALPAPMLAGEVVYQFRSREDPQAVDVKGCDSAPFPVNVRLPASLYVARTDADTVRLAHEGPARVGTALACVRIEDRTFAEGSQAEFYVRFELPEGLFTALGRCTMVSNTVPRPGVVFAHCALRLTEFPAAYVGGFATSASLFNPQGLTGFDTGSLWTLRVFEPLRPEK